MPRKNKDVPDVAFAAGMAEIAKLMIFRDEEIARLSTENAALRIRVAELEGAVEAARSSLELYGAHKAGCPVLWPRCQPNCNCGYVAALAILPAPGEPGKLMEALREVARLQKAVDAEQGDAPIELENQLRDAVEALCALVEEEAR